MTKFDAQGAFVKFTEAPCGFCYMQILLMFFLVLCVFSDIKCKRIPNILSFAGIVSVMILCLANGSIYSALISMMVGFLAFFPLFAFGALGAGDVKMMCVVSAGLGADALLTLYLFVSIASGIQAAFFILLKICSVNSKERKILSFKESKNCHAIAIALGSIGSMAWSATGRAYLSFF